MAPIPDSDALNRIIAERTGQGWRIVSHTATSAQLAKPKRLNPLGMMLFFVLPGVIGIIALIIVPLTGFVILCAAGLGLLVVLADYAIRKEELVFYTVDKP